MSSDLISLHIGDRILEVNGTPVKDQPVESIENLIQYSDTVLQVSLYIYYENITLHSTRKRARNIFVISVDYRARSRCGITATHVLLTIFGNANMRR